MKNTEKIYWKDLVEEAIKRRKEQKMTQKELAAFVGISTPTLQKFEDKNTNGYKNKVLIFNQLSLLSLGLQNFQTSIQSNIGIFIFKFL